MYVGFCCVPRSIYIGFCRVRVGWHTPPASSPDLVCQPVLLLFVVCDVPIDSVAICCVSAMFRLALAHPSYGSTCFTCIGASVLWKHAVHGLWRIRLMEARVLRALAQPSYGSTCFTGVGASVVWKHVFYRLCRIRLAEARAIWGRHWCFFLFKMFASAGHYNN